jgi:hypothetical protein
LSEGRRRAAILLAEEFGLQAEGENRRMEPLRRGLSGFMAALKTRGTALGMSVARHSGFILGLLSPSFFSSLGGKPYILC